MGQRANYILKENNNFKIYYHHWRANVIPADLYLGEKEFLEFVKTCQEVKELISEPWIEGCVFVDLDRNFLYFWNWEFPKISSLEKYYLSKLSEKWEDWKFKIVKNRMLDINELLDFDYIKNQSYDFENSSIEELENDEFTDWTQTLIIFKYYNTIFTTKTGVVNTENIISVGKETIPVLKQKKGYNFENETELQENEILIFDLSEKRIYSNDCNIGLWEKYSYLWEGYSFQMGDYGLVEILNFANIEVSKNIYLSEEGTIKEFSDLIKIDYNVNPTILAEELKNEMGEDIEFNPNFFDNPQPKSNINLLQ